MDSMCSNMCARAFTNLIQKITVYETRETFYILGSDEAETAFRIFEINRNDRKRLVIQDDHKIYSVEGIQEYLSQAKQIERKRCRHSKFTFNKIVSGYSLAGFVRFTEGFYLIIVTQRKRVAVIGSHIIYKVDGTSMLYIPGDRGAKSLSTEEQRYAKLFENMDFSNNFYFSFTYDITHTLQYNQSQSTESGSCESANHESRQEPEWNFVWNEYLLEPVKEHVHQDWIVPLIHGFLSQLNMSVYGKHIYMTLIARRSNRYAGTRFLKRGCNNQGHVANEVETEQIVFDASQTSMNNGAYTSFVQLRGSIPQNWSQDTTKVMAKPPISVDLTDPYGDTASRHFRELFERYGAPIIILNLVKRREKRKRESLLWDELVVVINYLNQFLIDELKIRYVAFDMARCNRKKGSNVLSRLDEISERCIGKTGLYLKNCPGGVDQEQRGIIRTNCVDCLDRTNTAQFAVGKHALGLQLHALGVTSNKNLQFDTDCIRMLETLFEDQGDTIALQYGGSNLVHRVQSYRKTNPLSAHSNDILQTLSRYYSNSFSDTEKQQAFNVFLGIYRPFAEHTALWDLSSDCHLHNSGTVTSMNYCEWVKPEVVDVLPKPYYQTHKKMIPVDKTQYTQPKDLFCSIYRAHELTSFDGHFAIVMFHQTRAILPKNVGAEGNGHTTSPFEVWTAAKWRPFMNAATLQGSAWYTDVHRSVSSPVIGSGFSSRLAYHQGTRSPAANNTQEGNSVFHTTTSVGSITEDSDSSSSEESDIECGLDSDSEEESREPNLLSGPLTFDDLLESPYRSYGVDLLSQLNRKDSKMYQKYEKTSNEISTQPSLGRAMCLQESRLKCKSIFQMDSEVTVEPPTVKKETKTLYERMVRIGRRGKYDTPKSSLLQYEKYIRQLKQQ